MFRFLTVPYPFESSLLKRLIDSLVVSLFVFLFLYIFQPFGLNTYPISPLILTLGYGVVSFFVMLFVSLIMLYAFPYYFNETKWTTGKELLWLIIMIGLIGLGNAIYTHLADIARLSIKSVFTFELYTLAVGVFPVSISVLINQARLRSSYQKSSEEINTLLETSSDETKSLQSTPLKEIVQNEPEDLENQEEKIPFKIIADNGKDHFIVYADELLFIRSADNYVEVFYHRANQTRCELIRTTLKLCTDLFAQQQNMLRCHKSYLVNLRFVNHVSGNAQGYKLHLNHTDELVPVSRTHNDVIKKRLSKHP